MSFNLSILLSLALCVVLTHSRANRDRDEKFYLPKLGLGTAGLGHNGESIVEAAFQLGVRLIDTAQANEWYDETSVGMAVDSLDDHSIPLIVTKIHPRSFSYQKMLQKLNESATIFKNSGIHAVLLHSPYCWRNHCTQEEEKVTWQEGWRNLELLKDHFNIKMIGVSNFHVDLLHELLTRVATRKVSLVQNWMDPYHQDKDVRKFCAENDIQYMAYSSFGTQWYNPKHLAHGSNNPVLYNDVLKSIARKHGITVSQVVLAWVITEGAIALPRSTKASHLESNFQWCSLSSICEPSIHDNRDIPLVLDHTDLEEIRNLDGILGEPWD